MRVFSTFTGIGGFEIGIQNAYRNQSAATLKQTREGRNGPATEEGSGVHGGSVPPSFVGYSEIDKYATKVYDYHFKGVKNYGDITKINADELPDFDCLVGGFPCQAFSIAGKRGGFADTRGTLFFDLARILSAKRPRLFVFENVKGLLSHDDGKTFRTIITAIDELGYDAQWQVINSKNHGVPQNRERIIIVGHLRGTPRPQVFPFGEGNGETANAVTGKGELVDLTLRAEKGYRPRSDGRAGTLDANYYKGIANQERPGVIQVVGSLDTDGWEKRNESIRRVYSPDGIAPTIPTGTGGGVMPKIITGSPKYKDGKREVSYSESDEVPTIRATHYKSGDNQPVVMIGSMQKNAKVSDDGISPTLTSAMGMGGGQVPMVADKVAIPVLTPNREEKRQNGRRFKEDGEPAFTVNTQDRHGIFDGVRIRRLTPLECERLQAFPDYWTAVGIDGPISDSQRYKMCGNAVTTNVIQSVFERIFASEVA